MLIRDSWARSFNTPFPSAISRRTTPISIRHTSCLARRTPRTALRLAQTIPVALHHGLWHFGADLIDARAMPCRNPHITASRRLGRFSSLIVVLY